MRCYKTMSGKMSLYNVIKYFVGLKKVLKKYLVQYIMEYYYKNVRAKRKS